MPYRRHSRQQKKPLHLVILVAALFVAAASCAWLPFQSERLARHGTFELGANRRIDWADRTVPAFGARQNSLAFLGAAGTRTVYPYSVVPGGVRDAGALKQAVAHDPVVAAHYADFKLANARVVSLAAAKTAYVSYRLGNKVYWTRKKLTLPRGEQVITDGSHFARTRCANRLAESPEGERSPDEPDEATLEQAMDVPDVPHQPGPSEGFFPDDPGDMRLPVIQDFSIPTELPKGGTFGYQPGNPVNPPGGPPYFFPPVGPGTPTSPNPPVTPQTPITPVPEPGTVLLFSMALSVLLALRRKLPK